MSKFPENTRCGFVSIIGLPNAGKSTLVNTLVGQKVSIVSRKVQTTRFRIRGIVMKDDTQIVLIDTPGIFDPKKPLEKAMVSAALETLEDADVIVHLVDAAQSGALRENRSITEKLPQNRPCVLVLNKIDQTQKPELLALAAEMNKEHAYAATFMISALKDKGPQDLMADLAGRMPLSPFMYDPEQITDLPARIMASEITREKIFDRLHQELPYAIMVKTEGWEDFDDGSLKINQAVYVQRDSQKGIVLGKGGSQIKQIGEAARKELEEVLGRRVHLKIFVKVQGNWAEKSENFTQMGLELKP